MRLLSELPAPMGCSACGKLSCLLRCAQSCIGLDAQRCEAHVIDRDGCVQCFRLQRELEKLTVIPKTDTYLAASRRYPASLYVLDHCFREIDSFPIRFESPALDDLWFDANAELIWIAAASCIERVNSNGDSLGTFLSAPTGTTFQALCTHENFLFVAFLRAGSVYLAQYTKQGTYLEKISLGGEYSVCNLQVLPDEDARLCLYAYAIKSHRFPYCIKVEIGCPDDPDDPPHPPTNPPAGLSVECVSESCGICSTCNVSTVRQQ